MAQAPQKPCDICQQSTGNYLCLVCEQIFCTSCKTFHKRQKSTKNHEFQLASEPIPEVKSKCEEHKEAFSFYCATCGVPVCGKCITGKHQGHRISDIQETVKEMKQKFDEELKPKVDNLERTTKHIIKELNRVENEASAVIKSVKEEANRQKAMIDRHADQLISSVKSDVDKEKSRLQKILDNTKTTMATARSVDDQKKTLDKNRPDGNLIGELKSLLDSMEKLTITLLCNGASVKYIPPKKTFQVEDVMGKYQFSESRQETQDPTRRGASKTTPDKRTRREDKKTGCLYRCRGCGHEEIKDWNPDGLYWYYVLSVVQNVISNPLNLQDPRMPYQTLDVLTMIGSR